MHAHNQHSCKWRCWWCFVCLWWWNPTKTSDSTAPITTTPGPAYQTICLYVVQLISVFTCCFPFHQVLNKTSPAPIGLPNCQFICIIVGMVPITWQWVMSNIWTNSQGESAHFVIINNFLSKMHYTLNGALWTQHHMGSTLKCEAQWPDANTKRKKRKNLVCASLWLNIVLTR